MRRAADIVALFSFRRISGQIAALVLGSLILIHLLIAGYFLLNRPNVLTDSPLEQFELVVRIIVNTPQEERDVVLENVSRTFPALKLQLRKDVSASTTPLPERTRMATPSSIEGPVDLIRGPTPEDNRLWFYLANGDVLEATIGTFKMPAFVSGLWTSTLLFLVASVTLLGVWAGRALSSPLSAFARAAEDFSLNRSSEPLPENGPEEIRSAARALNRMRERVTALMNDRTRMLAAISHDLRTPITRLRLRSEYIEDPAQRTQTVRDLDQMQSMLESVLSLLRSESAARPTLVDVAALLQMVCDQFSDSGYAVHYLGPDRAAFIVRPDEIIRAVTNLVENATRFGTEVRVELLISGNQIIIDVVDDGPGIPDERKAAMLEPFVRGEEARTMDETAGFGLGLSITQAIVTAHDGRLLLLDNEPRGLRVRLLLSNADRSHA
ncbi:signal transduction histidine kinase [Bradyrhizobium sp. R2.2-H]|jgi:signal transduction histidine kinase|uniref:ATP-binding protein n=1 Tax=unclassified Bradyrhizobium TaxID=2631580 RepID=UPI001052F85A|nr:MULTISPECIES: ATP-binding protein [unclassified Bradyrhizobium]TCU69393.1 signal transduction histidine kinase [Bradyrhizobium sp. Y-H1]TCU70885.1 signal transduction histidine kinase [Bradyrhizobium sp. R2.2-H]